MKNISFIALVFVIGLLNPFAIDSYLPSLPAMAEYFNATHAEMQFTITIYFLGSSLPMLFYGPFSDKFGRRSSLLIGYAIAFVGGLICSFAPTTLWLYAGRLLQGMGAASIGALFRTLMRDRFHGPKLSQAGAYLGMMFALTPAIAPSIGGIVQEAFGWQANFYLLSGLTFVLFFVIYFFLPETLPEKNEHALHLKEFYRNYKTLLSHPPFVGYVLMSSCAFSGLIAYYTLSPFLLEIDLGLTPSQYGYTALAVTLGLLIGHLFNSRLVMKVGIHSMLKAGLFCMFSGAISLLTGLNFFPLSLPLILIPTLVFLIGSSFTFSNTTSGAFHPFPKLAGSAGALFGMIQILITSIISLIVACFSVYGILTLGITFLLVSFVALVCYYTLCKRDNYTLKHS